MRSMSAVAETAFVIFTEYAFIVLLPPDIHSILGEIHFPFIFYSTKIHAELEH